MGQIRGAGMVLPDLLDNYIAMLTIALSGQRQCKRAMLTQSYTWYVSARR